uniref:WD_REPEATS_REGION domain-containing protein n=1 Tax=Ganoderma boninense TaxID=34458 RepID=A0A5K1K2E1_9APHY|nr:WD_REPEATS_REGION domain-containing protein [Ganoderma boninense]
MYSRVLALVATLFALALLVAANPVPNPEGVVARKPLKQYDLKRAIADAKARRAADDGEHFPKPSKVHRRGAPTPSKHFSH